MIIVTLTANPSNDRTVTLAGPLERGAVQRLLSVTMQAGGKGVNISRAAVSAGLATDRGTPCAPRRPVRHRAARRPASTAARRRPRRPTGQHHDHRARRDHHQAQQPRRGGVSRRTSPTWRPRCAPGRVGAMGRAGRVAAARSARRLVRRPRPRPARDPARVAVDTSEAPLAALVAAPPECRPRPDEAQRLGAGILHRRRPRGLRGRPGRPLPPRPRQLVDRGVGAVLVTLGAPAPSSSPRRRLARHPAADHGGQHRRGRRLQPLRLPVRRRSRRPRPERLALAVAYGSAAAGLPARPSQPRAGLVPSRSRSESSTSPRTVLPHDRPDHCRPGSPRCRPRRRQARSDSCPRAPWWATPGARRRDQLATDALAREATSPTGLPGGIAIPHCRTTGVSEPTLAFVRMDPKVDFGAKDGPADLAFLIAAPEGGGSTHLQLLTKLARALVKPAFTDSLRAAETPDEVVALVMDVVGDPRRHGRRPCRRSSRCRTDAPRPARRRGPDGRRTLVAVTACPTGIAHTYMAAEALEAAAERAGVDLHVETQGSAGSTRSPGRSSRPRLRPSSPSTWGSGTGAGSPASRSSPPESSVRSTMPTR